MRNAERAGDEAGVTAEAPLPLDHAGPARADPKSLGERAKTDGYLFLPGLVPLTVVEAVARRARAACARVGVRSHEPALVADDDPRFVAIQREVLPSREVALLAGDATLRAAVAVALGAPEGEVRRLGADVLRLGLPGAPDRTTPPHQDAFYLRQLDFWISWLPLEACPLARGPLAVVPGSHRGGLRPHAARSDGRSVVALADGERFAAAPLAPGDALLLSAHTVHRALENRSGVLRLSLDLRWVRAT